MVSTGDTLTINTSAVRATDSKGTNYNLSFRNYSYGDANGTWNYTVAHLSFVGNVSFESGSTVHLTGSNALAIISQNGGIVVNTSVNLTNSVKDSSTMFLGGFGVSTQPKANILGQSMYQGKTQDTPSLLSIILAHRLVALCCSRNTSPFHYILTPPPPSPSPLSLLPFPSYYIGPPSMVEMIRMGNDTRIHHRQIFCCCFWGRGTRGRGGGGGGGGGESPHKRPANSEEIPAQRPNCRTLFVTPLGLGPGASPFHEDVFARRCIPSAGHGGRGGNEMNVFGKPYGLQANNTLGGSGGTKISMLTS